MSLFDSMLENLVKLLPMDQIMAAAGELHQSVLKVQQQLDRIEDRVIKLERAIYERRETVSYGEGIPPASENSTVDAVDAAPRLIDYTDRNRQDGASRGGENGHPGGGGNLTAF
jgi:hypothetical protein